MSVFSVRSREHFDWFVHQVNNFNDRIAPNEILLVQALDFGAQVAITLYKDYKSSRIEFDHIPETSDIRAIYLSLLSGISQ